MKLKKIITKRITDVTSDFTEVRKEIKLCEKMYIEFLK